MVRSRKWLLYALCFIAGLTAATLAHVLATRQAALNNRSPVASATKVITSNAQAAPRPPAPDHNAKPWGILEALPLPLADPQEVFPDRFVRMQPPRWFFQNYSVERLSLFLEACGLSQGQKDALLTQTNFQVLSNGVVCFPSSSLVKELSGSSREKVYEVLAQSSANYAQCFPFRFPINGFRDRFASSGFKTEKISLLQNLTYVNCGDRCLADLQSLSEMLTPEEFNRVVDILYRLPAHRLRLRVYPDSDVETIVRYWGKGGHEQRIRPLLESLSKVSDTNGSDLSISYLLPPFARLRLDTFPDAWNEPQVSREDCFWTSMNFFSDSPDMRFLDSGYVRKALNEDYYLVQDAPTYGDLVTLINDGGDATHMCVYIAEDFVFTKNGMNQLAPWVLMKMSEMLEYFPCQGQHRMVIFRRKPNEPKLAVRGTG